MVVNYNEKIKKINSDRILMLNMVKENITKNNNSLVDNLNNVISTLNDDEIETKKYKSILKAKQLIFELAEQIVNANSVEEIINLRKKVNYYINKIKKELVERNIDQELIDKMYDSVDYLRNDITKYIRFLKRETKLTEISSLYENIDSLSPEDNSKFKILVSNEERYNKRALVSINDYPKKVSKTVKKKTTEVIDNIIIENDNNAFLEKKETDNNDHVEIPLIVFDNICNEDDNLRCLPQEDNSLNMNFLIGRIKKYLSLYQFSEISNYDGNFLKKCIAFLKNVPKYISNKKIIKWAELDYNTFYHGEDLGSFIDYFKKNNSIQLALEIIFKRSSLSKKELEYLFNHNKCANWIAEFCKEPDSVQEKNMPLVLTK